MVRTLHFRGQPFGELVIEDSPGYEIGTPPAIQFGLFQETATVNAESRNAILKYTVLITVTDSTVEGTSQQIRALQTFRSLQGDMEIKDDAVTKVLGEDWYLFDVATAQREQGHGGRFAQVRCTFVGEQQELYP